MSRIRVVPEEKSQLVCSSLAVIPARVFAIVSEMAEHGNCAVSIMVAACERFS